MRLKIICLAVLVTCAVVDAARGGELYPVEEPVTNMSWLVGDIWTPDEMAVGYALAATGTTSYADFEPTPDAMHVARWTRRGYSHSFMPVESHLPRLAAGINGTLFTAWDGAKVIPHPNVKTNDLVIAALFAPNGLGLVHGIGEFWYETNSICSRYVWKDMAFNRYTNNLVRFAVSLYPNGDILLEYGDTCTNDFISAIQYGTNISWLAGCPAGRSFLYKSIAGLSSGLDDADNDELSDYAEIAAYWTDPLNPDTDGDGLLDGYEIETSHTDPRRFDTDCDGLVDNIDPHPLTSDGDCFGQSAAWVAATFTNSAEILSVGYANWVDAQIGVGLENGLYKLEIIIDEEPNDAVAFGIDGCKVVVTNDSPLAFVLKKGVPYDVAVSPGTFTNFHFSAVDDIGQTLLRSQSLSANEGYWRGSTGSFVTFEPNRGIAFPSVLVYPVFWKPTLLVTPETWQPTSVTPSQTFTAVLRDAPYAENCSFQWHTSDANVVSVTPRTGPTTVMTCHYPDANEYQAALSLDVLVEGRPLRAEYVHGYDGLNDAVALLPRFPSELFNNDDDDNDDGIVDFYQQPLWGDEDVVTGVVEFVSTQPTNATITFVRDERFYGDVYEVVGSSSELVASDKTWTVSGEREKSIRLLLAPFGKSLSHLGSALRFSVTPQGGPTRTAMARFTVLEPVVEPICNERTNVVENGVVRNLVVNPCGVGVGRDAYFRIGLMPSNFPDDEIVWSASGYGRVDFPDGNTGRSVRVRGVAPGELELEIAIGDCRSAKPKFPLEVVENTTTKITAWIISKEGTATRTIEEVEDMVKDVNDIYSQVGMSFYLDSITVTNIDAACNMVSTNNPSLEWNFNKLVNIASGTGGLEVYFIGSFIDKPNVVGMHSAFGIAITSSGNAITLAHEIGHSCGMPDIYATTPDYSSSLTGSFEYRHARYDWNGGSSGESTSGSRYYARNTLHSDAIQRLLMDGFIDVTNAGLDIASGPVNGYARDVTAEEERYIIDDVLVDIIGYGAATRSPQSR